MTPEERRYYATHQSEYVARYMAIHDEEVRNKKLAQFVSSKGRKMLHVDYSWDLSKDGIVLDEELDIDKLGWKAGDYFKLVNTNGKAKLVKVDPLVAFVKGYRSNGKVD
jgi:hypothetical protein